MKYLLTLILLLVPSLTFAQSQRSFQSSRSRSVTRAPAVRAPAVRAPVVVRPPRVITPPRTVIRPPVRVITPPRRVVVRPGVGALRAAPLVGGYGGYSSSQSITQNYSTGVAPAQSQVQYDTQTVDVAALQAENQALREENAYLKGQLNK